MYESEQMDNDRMTQITCLADVPLLFLFGVEETQKQQCLDRDIGLETGKAEGRTSLFLQS